ncbi:MAG: YjfB family protein [Heliobacteriaceae bacterium]|nr:YjfB family protein [Heliobacteriaceae bacterium]MDD4588344.1 YjfB family protein [Heliobacteriaceae bacterium]
MNVGQGTAAALVNAASTSDVVSIAVLRKAMEAAKVEGTVTVKMMEQSITPYLGANLDIRA